MGRFERLSGIAEETIGLSEMVSKAFIKEQVIFFSSVLIGRLKRAFRFFDTRWCGRH